MAMVSKLDEQTIVSELDPHWVSYIYGFVPQLN